MSATVPKGSSITHFQSFLERYDENAWGETLTKCLPFIHEVDKTATQIWFDFYPLGLHLALQRAEDPEKLARQLLIQGDFRLANQIDSSHRFLYGHRYWPNVKVAVTDLIDSFDGTNADAATLEDHILVVARKVGNELNVEASLIVGIVAVAFMTVRQAGADAFKGSPGEIQIDSKQARKSPEQILKKRARDNSQGLLGFLKTVDKKWTVTFDEHDPTAQFKMNHMQDIASGAAGDSSRDWRALDPRRIEGPIPVECRSASCGTCWVGVLGGAEKLSEVAAREGSQIRLFGYIDSKDPTPLIRLACQAKVYGAVSIVIPPWNGVFGKYLRKS